MNGIDSITKFPRLQPLLRALVTHISIGVLLRKGPQFAAGGAAGMLPLTWNKPVVFLGFASKDFGELGSLFERSEF
ncbi:MAG: hypothetical protein LBS24_04290, partial [Clostridiales Family XIII bacterium]|nr:hypothetical protein [Clostridiales Family XIII bacterium]